METENPVPVWSGKEQQQLKSKLWLKLLFIGVMSVLLLIPTFLMMALVDEREDTKSDATYEIRCRWGMGQTVNGPVLTFNTPKHDAVTIRPKTLDIQGDVKGTKLKRGIYGIPVYSSELTMSGDFELTAEEIAMYTDSTEAVISVRISDLNGLADAVEMELGDQKVTFEVDDDNSSKLNGAIDIKPLLEGKPVHYRLHFQLNGSERLGVVAAGIATTATLTSDYTSPSFKGDYLPSDRKVDKKGFSASWNITVHRQHVYEYDRGGHPYRAEEVECYDEAIHTGYLPKYDVPEDCFSVEFFVPVDQYLQTIRSLKYAFLIIILTFAVVFFVEFRRKAYIHTLQYLLVGISLVLFYTLLLSFSECTSFLISYIIAGTMTVGLISAYMYGILRECKTSLCIGGLLTALYIFVYVLLQLETYALLCGSIGLFVILAIIMYASLKINWKNL